MISGLSMYGPQMTFKVLHTHHFSKGKKAGSTQSKQWLIELFYWYKCVWWSGHSISLSTGPFEMISEASGKLPIV